MHDNMKVIQVPKIDKSPIPWNKRRVVEFNVENGMKTLRITVNNEEKGASRIIKPFEKIEVGQWCVNQKAIQNTPMCNLKA